jgi:hypothetical protein
MRENGSEYGKIADFSEVLGEVRMRNIELSPLKPAPADILDPSGGLPSG